MAIGKKQRRKSSSAAIYVPVCVLLTLFFIMIGLSAFMKITDIEVTGASRYTKEEITEASELKPSDNLFFLNTGSAERRIQSVLPYISEVKIEARFPDRLHISVVESKAVATLKFRSDILMIDSAARVVETIEPDGSVPGGLIEVRGFTPLAADLGSRLRADITAETHLQAMRDMLAAIEREGFEELITYIDISNISNITFDYTDRFRVILDTPHSIRQNMALLQGIVKDYEENNAPGVRATIRKIDGTGEWRFTPER